MERNFYLNGLFCTKIYSRLAILFDDICFVCFYMSHILGYIRIIKADAIWFMMLALDLIQIEAFILIKLKSGLLLL